MFKMNKKIGAILVGVLVVAGTTSSVFALPSGHSHGSAINAKGYAGKAGSSVATKYCINISDATDVVNSVMTGCLVYSANTANAAVYSPTGVDKPYRVRQGTLPMITPSSTTLQNGSSGNAVKALQNRLAELGYLGVNDVDGAFGTVTKNAVIRFQSAKIGIANADGVVGSMTWGRLFQMT